MKSGQLPARRSKPSKDDQDSLLTTFRSNSTCLSSFRPPSKNFLIKSYTSTHDTTWKLYSSARRVIRLLGSFPRGSCSSVEDEEMRGSR